ncbi:MAG: hypothetical protein DRO11_04975 [Methanobacteriota archaeon]|mgnify:CR=1 FL=1|nr:MAG: hypothetical protein DRO11_04975 [Euryarchaeota archaeon]
MDSVEEIKRRKMLELLKKMEKAKEGVSEEKVDRTKALLDSCLEKEAKVYLQQIRKNKPEVAQRIEKELLQTVYRVYSANRVLPLFRFVEIEFLRRRIEGESPTILIKRRGEGEAKTIREHLGKA